jgi:hypothetical protein
MTRLQRYHRRRAIAEYTFLSLATLACLAFDVYVIAAWMAL